MKKHTFWYLMGLILFSTASYATTSQLHPAIKFGPYTITALSDGQVSVPLSAYTGNRGYRKIEDQILRNHQGKSDKTDSILVSLNAYLIQYHRQLILIDTGSGDMLPPKGKNGKLIIALKADGIKPSQINTILLTHLHPDHIGGLLTSSGKKRFINATIYINKAGWKFWHDPKAKKKMLKFEQPWFDIVKKELAPYQNQIHFFDDKKQVLLDGITALPLPGHTPGHTGYLFTTKSGKQLLIWGDLVHVAMYEFSHPQWSMIFDVNRRLASLQHKKIFALVTKQHMLVAGMHLPFPGWGYVTKAKTGYQFKPL